MWKKIVGSKDKIFKQSDDGSMVVDFPKNRIVELATVSNFVVEAGKQAEVAVLLSNSELKNCVYFFVAVFPQPPFSGTFTASVQWLLDANNAYTEVLPVFSGTQRAVSEWVELKAQAAKFLLHHTSETNVTYRKVTVFGVR